MMRDPRSNRESGPGAPDPAALAERAESAARRGPAPVHLWDPPFRGDLDMRIARDGTWFYQGSPITRPALVRLFASILRRDGAEYSLVTPTERFRIQVEDAPFVAVDVSRRMEGPEAALDFETNVGDRIVAGPDNPIRVEEKPRTGEPAPYVLVRRGLEARIDRKSFYRLAEIGEIIETPEGPRVAVRSRGAWFPIGPAA